MSGFVARWNKFLNTSMRDSFEAISLLVIRVIFGGGLALVHGWSKLQNFSAMSDSFPDPLHLKSSTLSLSLVIFGEFVCGLLVAVGFYTRVTVIPALITMLMAIFVIHGSDPYEKKELAVLYAAGLFAVLLRGGGPLSIDGMLNRTTK